MCYFIKETLSIIQLCLPWHFIFRCLIPPGFKQLLESYATCKNLHMGCVCSIAQDDTDCVQCFREVIKINLVKYFTSMSQFHFIFLIISYDVPCLVSFEQVMTLPTDLQFYLSICTSLSSYASAECSEKVCRLPTSPQHQFLYVLVCFDFWFDYS